MSELTLRELAPAPRPVREVIASIPESHIEVIRLTPEADELARQYLAGGHPPGEHAGRRPAHRDGQRGERLRPACSGTFGTW